MSPTTKLKVGFILDLDDFNEDRIKLGLLPMSLREVQDHLAKDGSVKIGYLVGGCDEQDSYYPIERVTWNVI